MSVRAPGARDLEYLSCHHFMPSRPLQKELRAARIVTGITSNEQSPRRPRAAAPIYGNIIDEAAQFSREDLCYEYIYLKVQPKGSRQDIGYIITVCLWYGNIIYGSQLITECHLQTPEKPQTRDQARALSKSLLETDIGPTGCYLKVSSRKITLLYPALDAAEASSPGPICTMILATMQGLKLTVPS